MNFSYNPESLKAHADENPGWTARVQERCNMDSPEQLPQDGYYVRWMKAAELGYDDIDWQATEQSDMDIDKRAQRLALIVAREMYGVDKYQKLDNLMGVDK